MNRLNKKYSRLEFQHKKFRLLNGEIILRCPYENLLLYILFKKAPEKTGKDYDIIYYIYFFWKLPQLSKFSWMIPEPAQSFYFA